MPLNSKRSDDFCTYSLPIEGNLFDELLASVLFENVGKGRQGTVLVKPDQLGHIPIVRTTTIYAAPAQIFQPVHEQLAQQIQQIASLSLDFNNALIETYTNAYTTMGSHSDQALDLAVDSMIAVFSCYQHPVQVGALRKLIIESKLPGSASFEIPLTHNSVVVFSLDTNRRFKHKIVLDTSTRQPENSWLGITFRSSKTFVRIHKDQARFLDDKPLTLANDDQRREFFQLRRRENHETDFNYPLISYTISESDLMPLDSRSTDGF